MKSKFSKYKNRIMLVAEIIALVFSVAMTAFASVRIALGAKGYIYSYPDGPNDGSYLVAFQNDLWGSLFLLALSIMTMVGILCMLIITVKKIKSIRKEIFEVISENLKSETVNDIIRKYD